MKAALVTLVKALGQVINAHYAEFDRETSELMNALANWVRANGGSE